MSDHNHHNHHNHHDNATTERSEKAFKSLQAAFALAGHTLARTEAKDGTVGYFCHKWGRAKHLPDLDAARRFLVQIGGRDV